MHVYRDKLPDTLLRGKRSVVTVGSLDGMHIGHQAIVAHLRQVAAAYDLIPLVVSFESHPRLLVDGAARSISLLQSAEERLQSLEAAGVEHLLLLTFNEDLRKLTARQFIENYAVRHWQIQRIVAGYNHSFGKDRSGDRESLITMGRELNFAVDIIPPVTIDGQTVSSTAIRKLLMEGEMTLANAMLGRTYSLGGRVVKGFGRGRRMGCPTANLEDFAAAKLIPRDGIYAALAEIDSIEYPAAVSIGFNPTFGGQRHSVEAHILEFDRDIYGSRIELKFVRRLRGEIKFSGEEALSTQMKQDIADIRDILIAEGHSVEPRQAPPVSFQKQQQ